MEIKALKELLPYCLENCTKKTLAVIKAEDDHTLTAVAEMHQLSKIFWRSSEKKKKPTTLLTKREREMPF